MMWRYLSALLVLLPLVASQPDWLVREILDYPNAVCNDGTPATYFRTNVTTEDAANYPGYVIYLQGGGLCVDVEECTRRCEGSNYLCTATMTPIMAPSGGIRSSDPDNNPAFHDYYQVYVPYCSSDVYAGDRDADNEFDFTFRGFRIIEGVIDSLKRVAAMDREGAQVVLTGLSAGGAGVGFTCPMVNGAMEEAEVVCIGDAAGVFPNIPCVGDGCEDFQEYLMRGNDYWNGVLPPDFNIYTFWKDYPNRLFGGIHGFDTWFLNFWGYNMNNEEHQKMWEDGMTESIAEMRDEMPDGMGLFVPSCTGHGMVTTNYMFNGLRVGEYNVTYAEAIMAWLDEDREDDRHFATDAGYCDGFICNDGC